MTSLWKILPTDLSMDPDREWHGSGFFFLYFNPWFCAETDISPEVMSKSLSTCSAHILSSSSSCTQVSLCYLTYTLQIKSFLLSLYSSVCYTTSSVCTPTPWSMHLGCMSSDWASRGCLGCENRRPFNPSLLHFIFNFIFLSHQVFVASHRLF